MIAFAGVQLYEPEELVLEAGAATPLAEVETLLATKGQQLAFEPPDYSRILGTGSPGTIGGLTACHFSGPRRIKAGALRDHILGVSGASGNGEIFKAGSRVMKNVTGYDLPKLMAGSWGTLAALTSVTFKVMPRAETEVTVIAGDAGTEAAQRTMSLALQSPWDVSSAAHVPGEGTFLRLEGIAASVIYRSEKLRVALPAKDILSGDQSGKFWKRIRDLEGFDGDVLWRVSLPPKDAPSFVAEVKSKLDCRTLLDWGGGLVWIACAADGDHGVVRAALKSGHAMMFKAPRHLRETTAVFQPQPPALAALSARVKRAFDPKGLLNPGRMWKGV